MKTITDLETVYPSCAQHFLLSDYPTPLTLTNLQHCNQEPTGPSKQPISTSYLGHVTGYQPTRDLYFLIRSVPDCIKMRGSKCE